MHLLKGYSLHSEARRRWLGESSPKLRDLLEATNWVEQTVRWAMATKELRQFELDSKVRFEEDPEGVKRRVGEEMGDFSPLDDEGWGRDEIG